MKQPQGSNYCWAVCAAVIVNKLKGSAYSYSQIANMFKVANPTGTDVGANIDDVIFDMNYYFSVNYAANHTTKIAPVYAIEHLSAGYPIYGSFSPGHATVIRGINSLVNTYTVMNPTSGSYEAGSISSDFVWSFISVTTGKKFTLKAYGYYKFL